MIHLMKALDVGVQQLKSFDTDSVLTDAQKLSDNKVRCEIIMIQSEINSSCNCVHAAQLC